MRHRSSERFGFGTRSEPLRNVAETSCAPAIAFPLPIALAPREAEKQPGRSAMLRPGQAKRYGDRSGDFRS